MRMLVVIDCVRYDVQAPTGEECNVFDQIRIESEGYRRLREGDF